MIHFENGEIISMFVVYLIKKNGELSKKYTVIIFEDYVRFVLNMFPKLNQKKSYKIP